MHRIAWDCRFSVLVRCKTSMASNIVSISTHWSLNCRADAFCSAKSSAFVCRVRIDLGFSSLSLDDISRPEPLFSNHSHLASHDSGQATNLIRRMSIVHRQQRYRMASSVFTAALLKVLGMRCRSSKKAAKNNIFQAFGDLGGA